jgi:hypothetical protein
MLLRSASLRTAVLVFIEMLGGGESSVRSLIAMVGDGVRVKNNVWYLRRQHIDLRVEG